MASRIAFVAAFVSVSFADARSYVGLGLGVTQSIRVGLALMQKDARTNQGMRDVSASLNEVGYQKIAALKSDDVMSQFVERAISHFGGTVINPAELQGFVPFFSGATATQTYDQLVRELADVPWVKWSRRPSQFFFSAQKSAGAAPGAVSPLDEVGYNRVVQTHCDVQMNIFIRRWIAAQDGIIENELDLEHLVPYYSGVKGHRTYDTLERELNQANWVASANSTTGRISAEAPLSEDGYKSVSEGGNGKSMELFIRRAIASVNGTVRDVASMQESASSHSVAGKTYAQLLKDLSDAPWLENFWVPLTTSQLNEQGYQDIANLHNNGEMGRFARLLLATHGGSISNWSGFSSIIPDFSGKRRVQNFTALWDALQHAHFVDWNA